MKNFAIIGLGGYVAPRHLQAIRDTGNRLVAAVDPNDSVGIIDSYFPDAAFFTEFERFDRHVDMLRRHDTPVDYVSICSPNYLHDAHIRFALRSGADAICEKPIVLNPWNIEALMDAEQSSGCKVNSILQLRLHESVLELKRQIDAEPDDKIHEVDVSYITSRGGWYNVSWKGDSKKSGGVPTNIGVHFFDMLNFVFGDLKTNIVHMNGDQSAGGYLEYKRARVRWFLSVDAQYLPESATSAGMRTHRSITVDGKEFEFSGGFNDLHTRSYEGVLAGRGFGLAENMCAIRTVSDIRHMDPDPSGGEMHEITRKVLQG